MFLLLVGGCLARPGVPTATMAQRIALPATSPYALSPPEHSGDPRSDDAVPGDDAAADPSSFSGISPPEEDSFRALDTPGEVLTLDQAVALGLRRNPRLLQAQARIGQARAGQVTAFAPFLPEIFSTYRYIFGVTEVNGFSTATLPTVIGFGAGADDFQLAEIHTQWTLYNFGKTQGEYRQAVAAKEVSEGQFERARQSVQFDVTARYLITLERIAERQIAEAALRRAEEHLKVSRTLLETGVIDRSDFLRAEVLVSESKLELVSATTAEAIAYAALNKAIGRNVGCPLGLVDRREEPNERGTLQSYLQRAIAARPEFRVLQQMIFSARTGEQVAKVSFLPRIYTAGTAASIEGTGVNNNTAIIAGINVDLHLFEGGRKIAAVMKARADVRLAMGQAQEMCDNIAFEVTEAYQLIDDARQRIELARVTIEQTTENLRLENNRFADGDSDPLDVIDAETSLTTAQKQHVAAIYGYQLAIARLEYALGTTSLE